MKIERYKRKKLTRKGGKTEQKKNKILEGKLKAVNQKLKAIKTTLENKFYKKHCKCIICRILFLL